MVAGVLRVELDGASCPAQETEPQDASVVRPPTDERLSRALIEVERLAGLLRAIAKPLSVADATVRRGKTSDREGLPCHGTPRPSRSFRVRQPL